MKNTTIIEQSYNRNHYSLIGYALKLTCNRTDAEDLVNDAYLKIMRSMDRNDKELENDTTTLPALALSQCFSDMKRRERHTEAIDSRAKNKACYQDNGIDYEIMLNLLKKNPNFKYFYDFEVMGYHYDEICEKYGISLNNLKSALHRFKKYAQNVLTKYKQL